MAARELNRRRRVKEVGDGGRELIAELDDSHRISKEVRLRMLARTLLSTGIRTIRAQAYIVAHPSAKTAALGTDTTAFHREPGLLRCDYFLSIVY
jgi:hypothetical protein